MHIQLPVTRELPDVATEGTGFEVLLRHAADALQSVTDTPRDEAEWLLAEVLGINRNRLRLESVPLSTVQQRQFAEWLQRRAAGEPFAYVTGTQPFRRLTLQVTPAVLIPRADTEHLVEWALQIVADLPVPARVHDACTGSGCIALALADECRSAHVSASDLSAEALAVASANGQRLALTVHWQQADALSLTPPAASFDLITANPPYVAEGDVHLQALRHEPSLALVSGSQGLDLLRRLVDDAPPRLVPRGWLLLEHGFDQAEAVRALLQARGFTQIETRRDYGGNERVTGGQWHG